MDAAASPRPGRKRNDPGRALSSEILLEAGRAVFAARGLEGARVDDIARRAGVNKQLVYHYFDSKDGLYTAVLEHVYKEIRQREQELDLSRYPAEEAMRRLVEFSFDYLAAHPDFVALLADENTHGGRHLQGAKEVAEVNRPIVDLLGETLKRGEADGVFRKGLDPLHVYLSIAGMAFFYFANIHTLSRIFNRELSAAPAVAERRAHIVDFTLNSIRIR
jgi:TetR/AcrR family transcriptional regulator